MIRITPDTQINISQREGNFFRVGGEGCFVILVLFRSTMPPLLTSLSRMRLMVSCCSLFSELLFNSSFSFFSLINENFLFNTPSDNSFQCSGILDLRQFTKKSNIIYCPFVYLKIIFTFIFFLPMVNFNI